MKIKKIKKLNNGKYKIEFDNQEKITTYDEVILKNNLLFHSDLNYDTLNELTKETTYYDSYHKALQYIMTKMRSEKEIIEYLNKKEVPETEQQSIIAELKNIGVLNNNNFTKSFIADKVHLSNLGPNQIRKQLEEHQIENFTIQEELEKYPNSIWKEKLEKLITKRLSTNHKYSAYQMKQKLIGDMTHLGYAKEDILFILNQVIVEDNNILEHEYQKLYQKLSKKFEGETLWYQMKNKLYQKGFSLGEIQKLIEDKDL